MKTKCEGCGCPLPADGEAYVCSYECTFCKNCSVSARQICTHCGGELVRRPRRFLAPAADEDQPISLPAYRSGLIWAVSAGVWIFVSLMATFTMWQLYRTTDKATPFLQMMGLECSQLLTYIPLTPLVFALALRWPLDRESWRRRWPWYAAAGFAFCIAHISMRALTPYAVWDSKHREWVSAIWDSYQHVFRIQWASMRSLFFYNIVDDITGTFVPIVLIAHAVLYYRKFQDRESHAAQLEGQLAKAQLQSLKSQLQPHFLFNTMHSISALMMTDVQAADRMITRLGDLLRMNLEAAGTQITSLNQELEFVNCYLEIEKVRFEERLKVIFDVAPEALDAQVPLLLLQPLVDNAVKHGISRRTEGGEVRITARVQQGELQLEIRDNGPGLARPGVMQRAGHGLRVTRKRLETLYGQNQAVELVNLSEGGVAVFVMIPFLPVELPRESGLNGTLRARPSEVLAEPESA